MPFFWDWIWEKLSGVSKTSAQPKVLDESRVDDKVREEIVRDRRALSTKKSNTGSKSVRVRSNDKSKAGGESTGKAVRAPASKNKAKSKAVPKG